jgi:zinc protease
VTGVRATRPTLPAPAPVRLPPVRRHQLSNGLEVLLVERHELPVLDAQLVVRSGAYSDSATHAGRAFMTSELLDRGTASRTATQMAAQAELLGASLFTRGSWDFCTAALHVLSPRFEPALELLADMVMRPMFPDAELSRRREERLAAILQEADEPQTLAANAFADVLYGTAHPYGLPIGGVSRTVSELARADVVDFYARRFAPANAYLVLVGNISEDNALRLIEQALGEWAAATDLPAAEHKMVPRRGPIVHIVDRPGATQSELRIGRPGPPRSTAEYMALLVANTVLGGAFSSRLNMLLREEKAYTYGAGSSFAFRAGGGPFVVSTAVSTDATADSVDIILREMRRMAQEPVSAIELDRARNYLVLGLPSTFETTGDIAEHVSEVALYGLGDDYYDTYADRVCEVSAGDVLSAAAHWLAPDDVAVVIAGDAAAVRADLESMGIGEVNVREVC